ncbi:molecular chaperone DnaJ [Synechococcus sp. CS-1328]|uniref:molecular chaperone DnaJ n=1 Tax=Synechococcus sp. CS-1328 TaxID=2847976 RepID=UPI00223B343D|nr:molecular chaperone DnaJ [Synechococcus sp. CS-1328]MCT0224026.1 molecular chaperone DnaJ [Synechococcus sp. CS-1328]
MPQTLRERSMPLVVSRSSTAEPPRSEPDPGEVPRGFGGFGAERSSRRRKSSKKKGPSLSQADWGPLGKHPDLDAIVARQRLHLPLSGRIRESDVTRAWKNAAAEHHPDRGGAHDTMQRVNGARDLLLGRGLEGG